MIASGPMPRSPVWLRKIPSTVSGSQGSRRGFPPAVRFAFPLGARLNITLRARPCQELFSESFFRPSRGPRGATPLGPLPFAATSSVLYAPPPRRGRETLPHTGCRQLHRGRAEGDGGDSRREGAPELALRPGPDAGPTRGPAFGDTPEKEGRAPPESARLPRGPPLGDRPWSILSAPRRFRSFQYRYGLGTTRIRALKHFRRVRF